jgi:hypothetical protein
MRCRDFEIPERAAPAAARRRTSSTGALPFRDGVTLPGASVFAGAGSEMEEPSGFGVGINFQVGQIFSQVREVV